MRDRDVLDDGLHFDLVVLDEAQRIKNTEQHDQPVVRSIRRTRNWALTGTPIENTPDDLVGIFEFLAPGYLRPGMGAEAAEPSWSSDYILRRTKDMVLTDMPPKLFRDAELDLTPEQRATYDLAENEGVHAAQRAWATRSRSSTSSSWSCGSSRSATSTRPPAPAPSWSGSKPTWKKSPPAAKRRSSSASGSSASRSSSTSSRRFGPLQYHGKIPSKQRDGVLEQFKEDPSKHVILMSYGAGSVGLNLQFCEYVFLFDRWWNPAVEDQAINRAHRIGAAGPVTVTRMLAPGHDRRADQPGPRAQARAVRPDHRPNRRPRQPRPLAAEIFGLFNLRTPKGRSSRRRRSAARGSGRAKLLQSHLAIQARREPRAPVDRQAIPIRFRYASHVPQQQQVLPKQT